MAKEVLQVFQDQFNLGTSSKPIKAIIMTHFHPDHTFGFDVFKVMIIFKQFLQLNSNIELFFKKMYVT